MLSIQKKISSYNYGIGNEHKYIILHYTGNEGDTAKNNVDYFYGGNRNASAHFFVDDNSIWQSVEESNYSWNCGDGAGRYGITNRNTLAIEMCCQSNGIISEKTENNAIELVKYLMEKYNIDINHVVRHYDASRKICPNWQENNWSRWYKFKQKLQQNDSKYKIGVDSMGNRTFSWNYYAKKNPDVVKVYGTKEADLYRHYIDFGKKEGRKPLPTIPSTVTNAGILYNRPDVAKAVEKGQYPTAIDWWLLFGWNEGSNYVVPTEEDLLKKYGINKNAKEDDKKDTETYFRVVAGSYKDRENAEEQIKKLKKLGVDGVFLTTFEK